MAAEFSFAQIEPLVPAVAPDAVTLADEVAAARAEAETLREQARAEGFAAGRDEALAALAPAAAALDEALARAREHGDRLAERLEAEAVDLAIAVADKVLAGALAVEPERVVEAVRGALRGIVDRERITILVHPDDLELVRDAAAEVVSTLGGIEHCEVQAERRVGRGGAVIRHPEGDVDARVEAKLERAREIVETALAER